MNSNEYFTTITSEFNFIPKIEEKKKCLTRNPITFNAQKISEKKNEQKKNPNWQKIKEMEGMKKKNKLIQYLTFNSNTSACSTTCFTMWKATRMADE